MQRLRTYRRSCQPGHTRIEWARHPHRACAPRPRLPRSAAIAAALLAVALVVGFLPGTAAPAAANPAAANRAAAKLAKAPYATATRYVPTVSDAVKASAAYAKKKHVTAYISVVDRKTGKTLAETSNANHQVASESVVKLFFAADQLRRHGGYQHAPSWLKTKIVDMIQWSDNAIASSLWRAGAVPGIAKAYGLRHTRNATDRLGHWGAARITAHDMTRFMYKMANDPKVGPWLIKVMAGTKATGRRGFNQRFGLNALSGTHGSKQGWGSDGAGITSYPHTINSVGYTSRFYIAVLTTASSYPDPARAVATYAAKKIQKIVTGPPKDGDFVQRRGSKQVYRIAGGAPIFVSSWKAVGGSTAVRLINTATWKKLRLRPRNGTYIQAGPKGKIYRVKAGQPISVKAKKGTKPIVVDPAAIDHAGSPGRWWHLLAHPGSAPCTPFTDVNHYHAFCKDITWLKSEHVTTGYRDHRFRPTAPVSRQAMAAFLYRTAEPDKKQAACDEPPVIDVGIDNVFCGSIAWLADSGITHGYSDGTFRPATAVSRGAMVAFLYRMHRIYDAPPGDSDDAADGDAPSSAEADVPGAATCAPPPDEPSASPSSTPTSAAEPSTSQQPASTSPAALPTSPADPTTTAASAPTETALTETTTTAASPPPVPTVGPFPDVAPDSEFCVAVAWAKDAGVTGGYSDGTFRSTAPVTRQAMAAFLHRIAGM